MGQCLLYRAGVVTLNLFYSLLSCAFFWSMFIYYRCYKHKLHTRIINNSLNGILWATSPHPSFYSQHSMWQTLLLTGLWMSVGLKNESFSVPGYTAISRQLMWRELRDTGMSSFSPSVFLSHPLLEGTSHCFFELQTPFIRINGLGRSVKHPGSHISTSWCKFILLITLLPLLSTGNRPQRERLLWGRKRRTFWSMHHAPRGCVWVKICRVMCEESKFSGNAHTHAYAHAPLTSKSRPSFLISNLITA